MVDEITGHGRSALRLRGGGRRCRAALAFPASTARPWRARRAARVAGPRRSPGRPRRKAGADDPIRTFLRVASRRSCARPCRPCQRPSRRRPARRAARRACGTGRRCSDRRAWPQGHERARQQARARDSARARAARPRRSRDRPRRRRSRACRSARTSCRRAAAPAPWPAVAARALRLAHLRELGRRSSRSSTYSRIDLVDGGQQRRIALADQRAFGDLLLAGAAGDRRAHDGVAQVDARGVDRAPSPAAPRRRPTAFGGFRVVEVGLRDELLRRQLARAFGGGVRVGVVGLRGGQRRAWPGRARPAAAPDRSRNSTWPSFTSLPSWYTRRCSTPGTRARTSALRYAARRPTRSFTSGTAAGFTVTTPTSGGGMCASPHSGRPFRMPRRSSRMRAHLRCVRSCRCFQACGPCAVPLLPFSVRGSLPCAPGRGTPVVGHASARRTGIGCECNGMTSASGLDRRPLKVARHA